MSTTPSLDWSQFTRNIRIDQPVQRLYEAWATPNQISQWFLSVADYTQANGQPRNPEDLVQVGDTYEWKWHLWDAVGKGEVTEANGKDRIQFSFGEAGIVTVTLTEDHGKTKVMLVQSGIPTTEEGKMNYYNGCSLGWSFWMVNLKAWLEHGITLNETETLGDDTTGYVVVNS